MVKSLPLENSDDGADQKMGRNNDNALGVPRANLEVKHMLILCSEYVHLFITYFNSVQ